jgi:hypothetical protein
LASSGTDSGAATVRSIPYTAPASVTRSRAVWVRASDLVWNTVPSGLAAPSFSPRTGEYRGCASHCIQSHAARIFHETPSLAATSRYTNSARASGLRAVDRSAFLTAGGICDWYLGAARRALTVGPFRLAGFFGVAAWCWAWAGLAGR